MQLRGSGGWPRRYALAMTGMVRRADDTREGNHWRSVVTDLEGCWCMADSVSSALRRDQGERMGRNRRSPSDRRRAVGVSGGGDAGRGGARSAQPGGAGGRNIRGFEGPAVHLSAVRRGRGYDESYCQDISRSGRVRASYGADLGPPVDIARATRWLEFEAGAGAARLRAVAGAGTADRAVADCICKHPSQWRRGGDRGSHACMPHRVGTPGVDDEPAE